ncbi:peptide chain release factor N(5)-glutamine methyltransferase [Chloroflexota bacterium]
MTIKQILAHTSKVLADNDIEEPTLESEILLRHALKINRIQLYSELENELKPEGKRKFWKLIERRLKHEPIAYITENREFYGLNFYVNHDVLIPRPESEMLVEQALKITKNQAISTIAEIGTGCGSIAISLALNLKQVNIYATDISSKALNIARINCQKHGVADKICLLEGDMLDPLPETVDLIIANLPYVKQSELSSINTIGFEPSLAFDGGPDGLGAIYKLCNQISGNLNQKGYIILEIGQGQSETIVNFLTDTFTTAKIEVVPDLSGIERVVIVTFQTSH